MTAGKDEYARFNREYECQRSRVELGRNDGSCLNLTP